MSRKIIVIHRPHVDNCCGYKYYNQIYLGKNFNRSILDFIIMRKVKHYMHHLCNKTTSSNGYVLCHVLICPNQLKNMKSE